MFDKLKKLFQKPEANQPPKEKKSRKPKATKELTDKEKATLANEPYVAILKVDVDPDNINSGGFELDWNDKFIINLIKAGYKKKPDETDAVIVDRWFQTVCRNIALEVYEQEIADPENRAADNVRPPINRRNLGDGKVELS